MNKDEFLKKWLNDELTNAERTAFEASRDYALNSKIIEAAKAFKASHTAQVDYFDTFKNKAKGIDSNTKKSIWLKPLMRIAAILVVALGAYFIFFTGTQITTETLVAKKTTIALPDESQVLLNTLTKIVYDKKDWPENRQLSLEGEAYFKVAKGSSFNVITKSGTVTVVGTEFNVKRRENYFEVKCFEGIVRVVSDTIMRELVAGDAYRILNNRFLESKTLATTPDWTENKSVFKAITFGEVLAELERQYAIEVRYKNITVDRLFTGGFTHNDLENALQSITQPMNLTYRVNSSNLVEIYEATE